MTAECFASDNVRNDKAMGEIIKVGMADLKVCVSPDGLTTLGLGSCVGIAIVDRATKIGFKRSFQKPDGSKNCRRGANVFF